MYFDSLEKCGPYSPLYGPHLILRVKNVGFENVIFDKISSPTWSCSIAPTYNQIEYFKGSIDMPVNSPSKKPIIEYWNLNEKADTILPNQEKSYLFEPWHGHVFRDSVSFILVELPIKSPYFDSLNINHPFAFNQLYPNKYTERQLKVFADRELKHPFYVFSTQDSLNIFNVTDAFIKNKVIKRK